MKRYEYMIDIRDGLLRSLDYRALTIFAISEFGAGIQARAVAVNRLENMRRKHENNPDAGDVEYFDYRVYPQFVEGME